MPLPPDNFQLSREQLTTLLHSHQLFASITARKGIDDILGDTRDHKKTVNALG